MFPNTVRFSDFLLLSLFCSLVSVPAYAHPLTTPGPSGALNGASNQPLKFLSLDLAASSDSSNDALKEVQRTNTTQPHAYIIHQQHLNHALSRFAKMTNHSSNLSKDVLVHAMNTRVRMVPERFRGRIWHRPGRGTRRGKNLGLDIWGPDYGYVATAQLGTPPRDYKLLVDSGSADLWVGGEGCQSNDGGKNCGPHAFLGPSRSSTFSYVSNISAFDETNPPWALYYVTGTVSGVFVQDDVSLGGVKIHKHMFGTALRESQDFTKDDVPFDGLLGLAKRDVSQQRIPPLLTALYNASLISAPVAAYKLPRSKDQQNQQGELTIGALNPALYDQSTLVEVKNVNPFGYFAVPIGGVSVGGKSMGWSNRTGLVDSGTVLMIAPQMDVDTIHSHIPGAVKSPADAAPGEEGFWSVPCDMKTKIGIKIGGRTFDVDPRDIAMWPVDDDGDINAGNSTQLCMSGISPGRVGPFNLDTDWMLGSTFLKNVYFATDEKRDVVSMAKLK